MRILILSKRRYTNLDLIDDRFGRLRELPLALASAGNEVAGICLSYRYRDEGRRDDVVEKARVVWHALNLRRLLPLGSSSYWATIDMIGREFQPDVVWACSDAFHAILGVHIAKRLGARIVIDLYDNFESFSATRIPFVTSLFRRALRAATGITCVSEPLARYVHQTTNCSCPVKVIENAVPAGIFYPMDQATCRKKLGLPEEGFIIGVAGAISKSRGIETLFQAFEILGQERPDAHLALAGTCDRGLSIPQGDRVHYLGMLPPSKVPLFLSTLDVSVICNRDSSFGRYCFPQKFYENVACGVPVVAAEIGIMKELLKGEPERLFEPDSAASLVDALRSQFDNPSSLKTNAPTWNALGKKLESFFAAIQNKRARDMAASESAGYGGSITGSAK